MRCDRCRLGVTTAVARRRRARLRPGAGRRASARRGARQRVAGVATARPRTAAEVDRLADDVLVDRRRLCRRRASSSRACPSGSTSSTPRCARSTAATEPSALIASSTSGFMPSVLAEPLDASRAARRRPSLQPRVPAPAGRGRRRHQDQRGRPSSGRWICTDRSACIRCGCGPRSTPTSPTACSRRCGARRCGSSTTGSPRPRRSTTRSATGSVCDGRRWACSRPTASPAASAGCGTSSPSSASA